MKNLLRELSDVGCFWHCIQDTEKHQQNKSWHNFWRKRQVKLLKIILRLFIDHSGIALNEISFKNILHISDKFDKN